MTLSSLLVPKTAAAAIPWKAAVSATPRRAFAALVCAASLSVPRAPLLLPMQTRQPGAPSFFSTGVPSAAARKPTGKASPKTKKAKTGPKTKKAAPAKGRVSARMVKVQPAKAKAARAKAKSVKTRLAKAKAKASIAKARVKARLAKTKARAVAKARARAVATAKAKARAAAKAKASRLAKDSIKAVARSILVLRRTLPKRNTSPWTLFCYENRPKDVRASDAMRLAMDSWRSSPASTKQVYRDKARASSKNFGPAMERWLGSLTPEQKALARTKKFQKTLPSYKARVIRRAMYKPRVGMYASFVKATHEDVRAAVSRARPDLGGKPLANATFKLLGEKWRALSAEQKKAYTSA